MRKNKSHHGLKITIWMLEEDSPERRYVECSECARTMQAIDGLLRNSSDCIFRLHFYFVATDRMWNGGPSISRRLGTMRTVFESTEPNSTSWCPATGRERERERENASQRPILSARLLWEANVKKRCPSHIDKTSRCAITETKFQSFEWKQWALPCDASSENTLQICQLCNFAHLLQLKQIICFMEWLVLCEIHFRLNTTPWSSLQMTQKFQTYNIYNYASQF